MYTGCIQQVYQYETLKVRQSNISREVTKENNPKDLSSISSLLFFLYIKTHVPYQKRGFL